MAPPTKRPRAPDAHPSRKRRRGEPPLLPVAKRGGGGKTGQASATTTANRAAAEEPEHRARPQGKPGKKRKGPPTDSSGQRRGQRHDGPKPARVNISEAVRQQKQRADEAKQAKRARSSPAARKAARAKDPSPEEKANYVGLDCEMVGVGTQGRRSALARACVVDWDGEVLLDEFVRPKERITDFRTKWSGVTAKRLKNASTFEQCTKRVAALLKGRVLVGHALHNDLKVLLLSHPRHMIRDTATYRPYMRLAQGKWRPRKLKDLSKQHLQWDIQGGEHTPDEDAKAAMLLYRHKRSEWETSLKVFKGKHKVAAVKQA